VDKGLRLVLDLAILGTQVGGLTLEEFWEALVRVAILREAESQEQLSLADKLHKLLLDTSRSIEEGLFSRVGTHGALILLT
jgi:hypothetical protein